MLFTRPSSEFTTFTAHLSDTTTVTGTVGNVTDWSLVPATGMIALEMDYANGSGRHFIMSDRVSIVVASVNEFNDITDVPSALLVAVAKTFTRAPYADLQAALTMRQQVG